MFDGVDLKRDFGSEQNRAYSALSIIIVREVPAMVYHYYKPTCLIQLASPSNLYFTPLFLYNAVDFNLG